MSDSFWGKVMHILGKQDTHEPEAALHDQVVEERRRLQERQARAERILLDFYRADAVIRGTSEAPRP